MSEYFEPPHGVTVITSGAFEAWILPLGARLMQLWWLTAPKGPRPLCLGYRSPDDYLYDSMSMGSVCGRYGNRIGNAVLERDGDEFLLDANHPLGHCIHGGRMGFGARVWRIMAQSTRAVQLSLCSSDGDQGFPGTCHAVIDYAFQNDHTLRWQASATVDRPCPINLIPHPYWNLDGQATITTHRLWVNANHYLPLDDAELPLAPREVDDTVFDFREPKVITTNAIPVLDGAMQLRNEHRTSNGLTLGAICEANGLQLSVSTDRPFLHLYGGARLTAHGAALGVKHAPGAGLCLETSDWPNGPANGREEVWYDANRAYTHTAEWRFESIPAEEHNDPIGTPSDAVPTDSDH